MTAPAAPGAPAPAAAPPPALAEAWRAQWQKALDAWSSYILLREPIFLETGKEGRASGMEGNIAAIRLQDQVVQVNLEEVRRRRLEDLALPVLAHEIGHHVYVPGNLRDNARMLLAMAPMLTGLSRDTPHLVANLYGDLLINDRLQRSAGVDVAKVYQRLNQTGGAKDPSQVWKVYTRTYEHLWRLEPGTLSPPRIPAAMNADAALLARLVRHFAGDWLSGARRFACILYPYLKEDEEKKREQTFVRAGLEDTRGAGAGAVPDGLTEIDPSELGEGDDLDDEIDPLGGAGGEKKEKAPRKPPPSPPAGSATGTPGRQHRQPFQYGEALKALGLDLKENEVAARYYRERALPHLIPFPSRRTPRAVEPLAEGYETWEPSDDLEDLDLFGSLLASPSVIPSITTVRRVYGETPGSDPARIPVDLDIYVDSSGSMPHPAVDVSYLALAGAILALSALRAGARVQATLWSGAGQFDTTGGFLRDESRILRTIVGYLGDGTAFPLNVLRDTYRARKPDDPPAHIVVISDDGADTMLQKDEKGTAGAELCARALRAARGGGTLVLNLPPRKWEPGDALGKIGFRVHPVRNWEELVKFARAFVRESYGERP